MTSRELKRLLDSLGATYSPGKGSHLKVRLNGFMTILPMHPGDLPSGTERAIFKQLGLKPLGLKHPGKS